MKKIICTILATILTVVPCTSIMSFAEGTYSFGDCNGDEMIDSRDATDILMYYAANSTGKETGWSETQVSAADINADGQIDSKDASVILSYYSYISTNDSYEDIYTYIEMTKDFKTAAPASVTSSDDGNYLDIEWSHDDEAEGYEIVVTHGFCSDDYVYGSNELVNTDIKTIDGTAHVSLPKIKLENTDYHEYESLFQPMIDYIDVQMTPYQIRNGKKLYKEPHYSRLDPYSITFAQQAKEPHDDIPVYNEQGEKPYLSWTSYVSANDKKILDEFEKEHFTDESTFERIMYMKQWIVDNLTYASDPADWNEIANVTYVDATLNHKKGQCIQYNGTLAAYAAYKGYDVKMIQGWVEGTTDWQHFWAVIEFDNGVEFELNLAI